MYHQTHEQLAARQKELVAEHEELGSFVESVEIGAISASVRNPHTSQFQDQAVLRARNAAEKKLASAPASDRLSCIEATIAACEAAGLQREMPKQQSIEELNAKIQARRDAEERERLRRLLGF